MLFNSYEFLFYFLPLALLCYYALQPRSRTGYLTFASYVFYGWWSPWFCLLMLSSTVVDYFTGREIHRSSEPQERKAFLLLSLSLNLGMLGLFKYYDWFAESLVEATGGLVSAPILNLVLPVGISFYTFQSMSYTIDIYRGRVQPVGRFIDFAAFVSLFPQLLAGPIVRYQSVAEQLRARDHTVAKALTGSMLFIMGLAKKVLLADTLAISADGFFDSPSGGAFEAWSGAWAYTLQMYFDFSGYTDMAIGMGLMLGFRFPINFNSPLKSASVSEFWSRWHISLSTWMRDYVFFPLCGRGVLRPDRFRIMARLAFSLVLTMVLCGLWHGAGWNFVLFGLYHGLALLVYQAWKGSRAGLRMPLPLARLITFLVLVTSIPLFRLRSLETAGEVVASFVGSRGLGSLVGTTHPLHLAAIPVATIIVWLFPNSNELSARPTWGHVAGALALLVLSLGVIFVNDSTPFIYYQF